MVAILKWVLKDILHINELIGDFAFKNLFATFYKIDKSIWLLSRFPTQTNIFSHHPKVEDIACSHIYSK